MNAERVAYVPLGGFSVAGMIRVTIDCSCRRWHTSVGVCGVCWFVVICIGVLLGETVEGR